MNKNFGLSALEFEHLAQELQEGNDQLFEHVFLAHFKKCISYLMRQHKVSHADAYDATMQGLLKFRKRLCAGKISYGNLEFLFTKMAQQCLGNDKQKGIEQTELEEALHLPNAHPLVNADTVQVMEKAWQQLEEGCSSVLKAFYYDGVALTDIATRQNRKPEAIRKQKQRCLEALRLLFVKLS